MLSEVADGTDVHLEHIHLLISSLNAVIYCHMLAMTTGGQSQKVIFNPNWVQCGYMLTSQGLLPEYSHSVPG